MRCGSWPQTEQLAASLFGRALPPVQNNLVSLNPITSHNRCAKFGFLTQLDTNMADERSQIPVYSDTRLLRYPFIIASTSARNSQNSGEPQMCPIGKF